MGSIFETEKNNSASTEQAFESGEIPHEYSYPCPLLTPENLGYSRPDPYPYARY